MLVAGNTKQSPANRAIFLQIIKRAFFFDKIKNKVLNLHLNFIFLR